MPKYTYDLTNGKKLTLEGDTQPSDDDVEQAAKSQGVSLKLASSAKTEDNASKALADTGGKETSTGSGDNKESTIVKDTPTEQKPQEGTSFLGNLWKKATTPLIHLTPEMQSALDSYRQENPTIGAIGNVAAQSMLGLSSPINVATGAVAGGELAALKAGLPKIASGLSIGTRALSVPTMVEGGVNLLHPDSTIPERISGGVELGLGALGAFHGSPEIPREPDFKTSNLPIGEEKPRYRLDPDSGMGIPIDQQGNQIGPAVGPKGEQLRPDLAQSSKYTPKSGIPDQSGKLQKVWDLARGMMSVDLPFTTSAAFRQSAPLVGTKPWFEAWVDAAKSYGSKEAFEANQSAIVSRDLFKPRTFETSPGKTVTNPSFAEEAGLRLGEVGKYSKREEALRGELAEKIPVYGKHVAGSNRAYTSFLNNVRADTFESLIKSAEEQGLNPRKDMSLSREIAEFVNTATGAGKIGVEAGNVSVNMEKQSKILSNLLFSPRKVSSEIRMLNPSTYIMSNPMVRNEYTKALARRVGLWWTFAGLAEMGGASVSKDPNSADFGKIKIGNTRIDPPGGLQQFLVLGHRMLPSELGGGGSTSSVSGKFTPFGQGYKPETRGSTLANFAEQRLHPSAKYIVDALTATKNKPFHTLDRSMQMFLPMFADDLANAVQEDSGLLPAVAATGLSSVGMGVQSYTRGSYGKPTFIPEQYDLNYVGR